MKMRTTNKETTYFSTNDWRKFEQMHKCVEEIFSFSHWSNITLRIGSFVFVSHIDRDLSASGMINGSSNNYCVRLRGLPWNTTSNEIQTFLQGFLFFVVETISTFFLLVIIFSGCQTRQIHLCPNETNRPTIEAFVTFESKEDFDLAKTFNQKSIGSRK